MIPHGCVLSFEGPSAKKTGIFFKKKYPFVLKKPTRLHIRFQSHAWLDADVFMLPRRKSSVECPDRRARGDQHRNLKKKSVKIDEPTRWVRLRCSHFGSLFAPCLGQDWPAAGAAHEGTSWCLSGIQWRQVAAVRPGPRQGFPRKEGMRRMKSAQHGRGFCALG